jgi:hypothetical protein
MQTASLNPLREALISKGLPADYIRRTLGELADHLAEAGSVDAERLGNPRRLAKQFAREYRGTTFAGRHPFLSSLLLAFVLMHLLVIAYYLATTLLLVGLSRLLGAAAPDHLGLEFSSMMNGAFALGAVVPFVFVARLTARQVRRMGRGRWSAIGLFAVVTLLAGLCATNMQCTHAPGGHGTVTIGYGLTTGPILGDASTSFLRPLTQALVVAGCGGLFCRRMFSARHTAPESAEE